MAQQGATLYYMSKQVFDFDRIYSYLKKSGLSIKHPDTQIITGLAKESNLSETSLEKVKNLILNQDDIGINLWLEDGQNIFWSFSTYDNYFSHNFDFNYLIDYDRTEREISPFFTKFALSELYILKKDFIGFTLDQFGSTEWTYFGEIFDSENNNILNQSYIAEITFLQKEKLNRISLDDKSEVISINDSFSCISRDEKLGAFMKSLL